MFFNGIGYVALGERVGRVESVYGPRWRGAAPPVDACCESSQSCCRAWIGSHTLTLQQGVFASKFPSATKTPWSTIDNRQLTRAEPAYCAQRTLDSALGMN